MRSARLLAGAVLTIVLALSSAQSAFASIKLYYDTDALGGYGGSFSYAGVRFSLPSGVNSAHLLDIQYGWSLTDTNALTIYITGSSHETLLGPIPVATSTWLWNTVDVSGSGLVVSGDFYVVIQRTTTVSGSTLAFDNGVNVDHRSCIGGSLALPNCLVGENWMIRVDIDPIVPSTPVGGFLEPVNKLALLAPWLTVIGLVGCIGTVVVIRKKRHQ